MPSSDEIIEAHAMVEKWYKDYFKKLHPTWPNDAIDELMVHIPYKTKRNTFINAAGGWGEAYSDI